MIYPILSAEEAAEFVQNGFTVGVSGFTSPGCPQAVPVAIAERAKREHEAGREFKINLFSGASTSDHIDGELTRADALNFRTPYQSHPDMRKAINANAIHYNDRHLSELAQEFRYGFYGKMDIAIVEAQSITDDGELVLGTSMGNTATWLKMADKVIVEVNDQIPESILGMHDVYTPLDPPCRREIPIYTPHDRVGTPTAHVDPKKVLGVVKTSLPISKEGAFTPVDDVTAAIGRNVCAFLVAELKAGRIPKEFLPLQSGVGNIANAVLDALDKSSDIPAFEMYTEVIQDSVLELLESGKCKFASTCSMTFSSGAMTEFFEKGEALHGKVLMRPSEISNNPEVVRRLGVITMNTAIEADIYGHINSTHVSGTRLMNGVGGSGDFTRNAYIRATSPATPTSASSCARRSRRTTASAPSCPWCPILTTTRTRSTSSSPTRVSPTCAARTPYRAPTRLSRRPLIPAARVPQPRQEGPRDDEPRHRLRHAQHADSRRRYAQDRLRQVHEVIQTTNYAN